MRAFARPVRLAVLILICAAAPAMADNSATITLTQLAGGAQGSDGRPLLSGLATGELKFQAENSRDVKAELSLLARAGSIATIDVYRAWVKARFPAFRATLGRTRLAWGDGFFFNAGDLLFGSLSPPADLTADEIRSEGAWLASAFVPIERFSFFEAVFIPPQPELTSISASSEPRPEYLSAGGRLQAKLAQVKSEAAYLYRGRQADHLVSLSLQGNLAVDLYAAVQTGIPAVAPAAETLLDNLAASWGIYHIIRPDGDLTLNLRLEGLLRPRGAWQARSFASSSARTQSVYGLYLYPEISAGLGGNRTVFLRAVVSPLDLSGMASAGAAWTVYQGFSVLAYAGSQAGESEDQFSPLAAGGWFAWLGCKFVF